MGLREQRRADRVAEREQDRLDRQAETQAAAEAAQAQAEAEAIRQRAADESRQAAAEQRRADQQAQREHAEQARAQRRQARQERLARVRQWAGEHAVELLIYPLALVSAVVAIPAMASYGTQVYATGTGWALPLLTELGMWAFAVAVQVSRARDPQRPVWALQTGVGAFAAVALGLNMLHGAQRGLDAAVVMGVASIAGVVAHQLVTASPRRSRTERHQTRIERAAARRELTMRHAAVRQAVGQLDESGTVHLLHRPGLVTLDRRIGRRPRLVEAVLPGQPVSPVAAPVNTDWDTALAHLLEEGVTDVTAAGQPADAAAEPDGGVALAEPGGNTAEPELAELCAQVRRAIAAGEVPARPSQRAIRELLGIRTARASQVQRALRDTTTE